MSTINLPGFTAEASLYRRGGHCYVANRAFPMAGLGQQAVFPQAMGGWTREQGLADGGLWRCWYIWGCFICCTPWWCWYVCRAASFNGAAIE
jgi:hypothetical protein